MYSPFIRTFISVLGHSFLSLANPLQPGLLSRLSTGVQVNPHVISKMDSPMFGTLVHVEPASALPAAPGRVFSRTRPAALQRNDDIELQATRPRTQHQHAKSTAGSLPSPVGSRDGDAVSARAAAGGGGGVSGPSSPVLGTAGSGTGGADAVEAVQSLSDPPMNRYRLMSICLMQLSGGLNDAAPGALIPYMET